MKAPSDFHPDLVPERLNQIADILIDTRDEAVDLHNPAEGDGPWSLGCRVYERSCSRIIAASNDLSWLTIMEPPLRFIFQIGAVPVRFYRGTPNKPTDRTMAEYYPELDQLSWAFPGESESLRWRFAVEADYTGQTLRVIFAGLSENRDVRSAWVRKANEVSGSVEEITAGEIGEGVEIAKPEVVVPSRRRSQSIPE